MTRSVDAPVAGSAQGGARPASGADAEIERIGSTAAIAGLPAISLAVVHAGIAHLSGITPDPVGDVRTQTRQVLRRLEKLLASIGADRSRLLSVQVWLSDMALFDAHNEVWNEWVDRDHLPARVCVEARLWQPGMTVEVMATAAVGGSPPTR